MSTTWHNIPIPAVLQKGGAWELDPMYLVEDMGDLTLQETRWLRQSIINGRFEMLRALIESGDDVCSPRYMATLEALGLLRYMEEAYAKKCDTLLNQVTLFNKCLTSQLM